MDGRAGKTFNSDVLAQAGLETSPGGVIDGAAITNLEGMLGEEKERLMPVMIGEFIADARELQAAAERALGEGRRDELRRAAHTLKSTSATFGVRALSSRCRELETMAGKGDLDGAGTLIDKIRWELDRAATDLLKIKRSYEAKNGDAADA